MAKINTLDVETQRAKRLNDMTVAFKAEAIARSMQITPDGRISEADAAELLCVQPASLKALRHNYQGPSFYQRGAGNGSRVSYRFDDLAAWIEVVRVQS